MSLRAVTEKIASYWHCPMDSAETWQMFLVSDRLNIAAGATRI